MSLVYCQMPLKSMPVKVPRDMFFSIKDNPRHKNRTQTEACAAFSKYLKSVSALPKEGDICGS